MFDYGMGDYQRLDPPAREREADARIERPNDRVTKRATAGLAASQGCQSSYQPYTAMLTSLWTRRASTADRWWYCRIWHPCLSKPRMPVCLQSYKL